MKLLLKKRNWIYLALLLVTASFVCFFRLDLKSFSLDEVSTINFTRDFQYFKHSIWFDEGNMWLYYFLMHFWLRMGDSEFIVRGMSALFGVLSAILFYFLTKEVINEKTARISVPLFITNLYFIYYAQTARSYGLALLLSLAASYCYIKFAKNISSAKYLVIYSLISVLMFYTYILTALLIAAQFLGLLFLPKIPWKKMIFSAIGIGIGLIPLLISPAFHGSQVDWLQKPSFVQLAFGILALGGDSVFVTGISCLLLLGFLIKNLKIFFTKKYERFLVVSLFLSAFLPLTFAFFFSLFVKPLYEAESFNSSLPAFILLIVFALTKLKESKLMVYRCVYIALLLFSIVRVSLWYADISGFSYVFANQNTRDWRATEKLIEHEKKDGDAIIFYAYYIRYPFSYYANKSSNKNLPKLYEISSETYALGGGTTLPEPDKKLIDTLSLNHNRVWVVLSYHDFTWLNRRHQWKKIENELKNYYSEVEDKKLDEIEIKLFVRKNNL